MRKNEGQAMLICLQIEREFMIIDSIWKRIRK